MSRQRLLLSVGDAWSQVVGVSRWRSRNLGCSVVERDAQVPTHSLVCAKDGENVCESNVIRLCGGNTMSAVLFVSTVQEVIGGRARSPFYFGST